MQNKAILNIQPLGFPWQTQDPFIFCAYHNDHYPKGNEQMGPDVSLDDRNLGQDFNGKDGWSMYHGSTVPGFPYHPHRGFETVTIATTGLIDHSDSLGAAGRFGNGDVQWMTAGKGVLHSEMFPLLNRDKDNPLELFQIWLNLPRKDKMVEPHFSMLWAEDVPIVFIKDESGKKVTVRTVAGSLNDQTPPSPPPHSWAKDPANQVAIWTIEMEAGARWTLPKASEGLTRSLYFYRGDSLTANGQEISGRQVISVDPTQDIELESGSEPVFLLMLQGRPIAEPVVQYGPFVMNSEAEIRQAYADYRQTQFGGWPWPDSEHTHPRERGRFALHADGREEVK